MSNYKCWVQDFPKRSLRLLEVFEKQAQARGLEVTLLLSVASATICIPNDRLQDKGSSDAHIDTKRVNENAVSAIDSLLKTKIQDIQGLEIANAPFGKLVKPRPGGKPDCGWDDYRADYNDGKCCGSGKQFGTLIKHLRNALAHGNVYTLAGQGNQIDEIVFLKSNYDHKNKKPSGDYDYLTLTPKQLSAFLRHWVTGLQGLGFQPEEISYAISQLDEEELDEVA